MRLAVLVFGLAISLMQGFTTARAAPPGAEVRYVITNGGQDVHDKGGVHYVPAGHHDADAVAWGGSGDPVRMPAGTYDVHVTFDDGAAHKELWIDKQTFSGKMERTVEIGLPVTEVRYHITNGGQDVHDKGGVHYVPAGHHDADAVAWGGSGDPVRMPAGTYDVHVTFDDGSAHKELWLNNQKFSGTVEKTAEIGLPVAEVRYHITNGGQDTHDKGQVHYVPAGHHDADSVAWASSGDPVRIPAGAYDVHVTFDDGSAHKERWIDNQKFSGTVEKTVEIGVSVAEIRYHITNGGQDTHDKGQVHYVPAGHHDADAVAWASSGDPVRIPAGTYDVHVTFDDGSAHKERWIDNQKFSGQVEKTIEIGISVAEIRYHITNGGQDTHDKGQVHYFPAGHHDANAVAWASSDDPVRIPAGSYDVNVTFDDGAAHKELWINNEKFSGKTEKTVEIGLPVAEVGYRITNGGQDTRDEGQVHYFLAGHHDDGDVAWATSGAPVRLAAGSYNVRVDFTRGFAHKEIWLDNQSFSGTVAKTVELGLKLAEPTVAVTLDKVDLGNKAHVTFIDPGENYEVGGMASGGTAVLEAGTYDIRASYEQNGVTSEARRRKVALAGKQHLTIELHQPKAELRVTVRRDGHPLAGAWCGVYTPNSKDEALGRADSGAWQEIFPATYDIGCFHDDEGVTDSAWIRNKRLPRGKTDLTIDLPAAIASLTITARATGSAAGAATGHAGTNIEFILDASGSMAARVDKKETRIQAAKAALETAIAALPDKGVNVALRVYGTRATARACRDSRLAVPLGALDRTALRQAIAATVPRGRTPIAANLKEAAHDLPKGGTNALVLITDGLENCGGDPCAVASRLAAQGIVTRSFVVGFTLGPDQARLLRCIGHYYPASDRTKLSAALADIVRQSIAPPTGTVTLTAADGTLAGQGTLGQKISVRTGRYDVRIAAGGKVRLWKAVLVKGDMVAPLADAPP